MAATLVQSKSAAVNTGTATNTVTWDTAATAGNVLVIIVAGDDYISAAHRPSGFTFSTGMGQETFLGHYLFWKVAAGGETSASYTLGSAATSCWITAEISGLSASPYDTSNGTLAQSSGNTQATPTITPSSGDRYVIGSIGGSSGSGSMSLSGWTNSFTERQDIGTTLGSGTRDVGGYADLAATYNGATGVSTTATYSSTAQSRTSLIIAFKVATGSSPQTLTPSAVTDSWTVGTSPLSATVTLSPSAVAPAWTVPSVSVTANVTLSPAVVASAWTVPTVTANLTIPVTAIAPTWTVGTASIGGVQSLTPSAVSASWSVPSPTIATTVTLSPSAATDSWTVPSPSVVATVSLAPSVVTAAWTVPTSLISAPQTVSAALATAAWTVPAALLVAPGNVLGDLTTLFTGYVDGLHDTAIVEADSNTLVANDLPTVRAATSSEDDLNTAYDEYLS